MEVVIMGKAHTEQIAQLEKICFSDPWSLNSINYELSNPLSLWLVMVQDDTVVGYIGSQSVLGESDMMNLAVAPDYRRQGVAEKLVLSLIEQLHAAGNHCLTLEVRVSNFSAITLYHKLGFREVGKRPNYYRSPKEDALILRKEWQV